MADNQTSPIIPVSDRLRTCIDAGGVVALFPLLKDWPKSELLAVVEDCETYHQAACAAIDAAYQKVAFQHQNFFNRRNAKAVDAARDEAFYKSLAMTSEICSVALYYIEEFERAAKPEVGNA